MKEFDIISIGGGSGGIATMNRAGEHGARAAVIEEKQLGGTCGMALKLQKPFVITVQIMGILLNRPILILLP